MSAEPHPDPSQLDDEEAGSSPLKHLLLFAVTLLCVFNSGAFMATAGSDLEIGLLKSFFDPAFLAKGASFALPLMAILVTHEFGHYFAARYHKVPASLPYFIPLPVLGWGTLGAVIAMRGSIRSRNALFDIGASGPLAGLFVAVPVLAWGLAHSPVEPRLVADYWQEGQSLLYLLLKRIVLGPIPSESDVFLHPTAFAGWVGLLITMINLLPWGQLDGGHIAFALFGERQYRFARWFRRSLPFLFLGNLTYMLLPVLLGRSQISVGQAISNSLFWLIWFLVLGVIARASGGADHPPCEPGQLSPVRRALAWACLALFVLLFLPMPMVRY